MSVLINASTSGGVGITSDNSGIIQFQSAGANTVQIDASGNMGIGTASPSKKLDVTGDIALSTNATYIYGKTSGGTATRMMGINSSNALYIGSVDAAVAGFLFNNNGVTSMAIDSSGNVGVGTTSPSGASGTVLEVNGGAGQARFVLKNNTTGSTSTDGSQIALVSSGLVIQNRENSYISFETNGSERGRFAETGELLVGTASTTSGGGILQLSSGITFPATQVASANANTLDDYEEGTFTPTVIGTTAAGTATYAAQVASYTKIGNRVLFTIALTYTGGNGTGNLRIAGLPFTVASDNIVSIWITNLTLTANNVVQAYASISSTQITIEQYPVGGGAVSSVAYDAAASLYVSGQYNI